MLGRSLTLGRDPFARGSLRRNFIPSQVTHNTETGATRFSKECAECGQAALYHRSKTPHYHVFELWWEDDQGTRHDSYLGTVHYGETYDPRTVHNGHRIFCSMSCARHRLT